MSLDKQDFQILYITEGCYKVLLRIKFLYFFYRWVPITYQESENSEDKILEFESFIEATNFIDTVTK